MTEIDLIRYNAGVDPQLHVWGWEIPVYLFLGGMTAGLMILTALLGTRSEQLSRWARWLPFAAPVALSVGMLALFLDLAFKLHVFRFYLAFQPTSPMSWGSWILLAIYPAALLLGLGQLEDEEVDRLAGWRPVRPVMGLVRWAYAWATGHLTALRRANILLGVALGGYTGILLGTLGARAVWGSAVLGPLFLVSGISAGAALMMLFPVTHDEHTRLRGWDLAAVVTELALLMLFLLGLATGGASSRAAAGLFLGGAYTAPFWALVVIAGLVVPLIVEGIEVRKGLRPTVLAPVLLLVGGLALRWVLVGAGQAM